MTTQIKTTQMTQEKPANLKRFYLVVADVDFFEPGDFTYKGETNDDARVLLESALGKPCTYWKIVHNKTDAVMVEGWTATEGVCVFRPDEADKLADPVPDASKVEKPAGWKRWRKLRAGEKLRAGDVVLIARGPKASDGYDVQALNSACYGEPVGPSAGHYIPEGWYYRKVGK